MCTFLYRPRSRLYPSPDAKPESEHEFNFKTVSPIVNSFRMAAITAKSAFCALYALHETLLS